MNDPSEVLGVAANADDATVRRRYLELVRQYPPERSPQRFAEIRAAYDQLRNPASRLERQILHIGGQDSLDDIIAAVRERMRGARIPVEVLLSLGDS